MYSWSIKMRRLPLLPNISTASTSSSLLPRLVFAISILAIPYSITSNLLIFSPRLLLFSPKAGIISLLLAPWTRPSTPTDLLSRFLQSLILCFLPSPTSSATTTNLLIYSFWIMVGLTRTLIGFILTRSVGWKYPSWFSHQALYEPSTGIGAGLVLLFIMNLAHPRSSPSIDTRREEEREDQVGEERGRKRGLWVVCGLVGMVWLERRIWTYSIAWGLGLIIIYPFTRIYYGYLKPDCKGDRDREEGKFLLPPLTPASPTKSNRVKTGRYPFSILLLLGGLNIVLLRWTGEQPPRLPYPSGTRLDIIILSYPRPPSIETSMDLLDETLGSFVRSANTLANSTEDVGISVFTHSKEHEAMDRVKEKYETMWVGEGEGVWNGGLRVGWKVDRDVHEEDQDGHFLHLAEAFRYALELGQERGQGQDRFGEEEEVHDPNEGWILLVEDDFPVCPGGWQVVETVMNRLVWWKEERGAILSGFIGTGGSGFIIHRSYLPILVRLLRTYSSLNTTFPSSIHRPFPDQLVQTCLLGLTDGLCERRTSGPDEPTMIIPSRLVLDHRGGMATTTEGKLLNSDRWRCGWRHPFHGFDRVEVVEV